MFTRDSRFLGEVIMDAAATTCLVLGVLNPHASIINTSVIHSRDEKFSQYSQRLYEALHARFTQEADGGKARRALELFTEDSGYGSGVEKKLLLLLQTDPAFAHTLHQIIEAGPRQELTVEEEAQARRLRMANTLGIARQEIKAGKYSTVSDVRMNIDYVR
jgi:hypothetical protein